MYPSFVIYLLTLIALGVGSLILRLEQLSTVATVPVADWSFSEWLLLVQFVVNLGNLVDHDIDTKSFQEYIYHGVDDHLLPQSLRMSQILKGAFEEACETRGSYGLCVAIVLHLTFDVNDLMEAFPTHLDEAWLKTHQETFKAQQLGEAGRRPWRWLGDNSLFWIWGVQKIVWGH